VAANGIIQRKLALLEDQVGRLERHLREVSRGDFTGDWVLTSMAERALQVAAEIMIDVAERIIALKNAGPVESATKAIRTLVDLGVIASEAPYVDIVRFRNLIVHEYEKINPDLLYELATTRLSDFRAFRAEIDRATESL